MRQPLFTCCLLPLVAALSVRAADDYTLGSDSMPQPGVPRGEVMKYSWNSKIFPGTERDCWVYVPAQYSPERPACVMVFQDGGGYVSTNGAWRVPAVFDNLIHKKEMPVTIGVFINPGVVPAAGTNALARFNRSFEYDGLGDRYARFLLEEILPEVEKKTTADGRPIRLSTNANDRAICGASSGAICAFTVAWERPDAFRRVYSTIGTYVGLRGGDVYPTLVRKTEPKPIRIFLQDGSGDLNIYGGNWWMANQSMLSALQFAGYDVKHEWGDGGHTSKHGAAILPEALRWLWRDYPAPIQARLKGPPARRDSGTNAPRLPVQPVCEILVPDEPWQLVSQGHRFTEGPTANSKGEVFFTDIPNNRIHKVGLDGKVTVFAENTGGANGLMFGADGFLYACANGQKKLTRYNDSGEEEAIIDDLESNDLVARSFKDGYVTDPGNKRVWYIDSEGEKRVADTGINFPNGVITSPDQTLLYVADMRGQFVYSFQILPDGALAHKQPYFHLHIPDGESDSGADGMTVDTQGRIYVATRMGLQVCDQAGRVIAIISKPQKAWLANVCFGGVNLDELYVTCSDKVYKRKTRAKGVLPFQPPAKPPAPRL